MTNRNKPPTTVRIAGKAVSLLQAALIVQEADRLGVLPREVGSVALPEHPPASIEIGGKVVSTAAGAALAVISDSQGVPARQVLDSLVEEYIKDLRHEEEAKALQVAARAFDATRKAITPAAIKWFRGHGYEASRKVPPMDRVLARAVLDHVQAEQRLEQCLRPEHHRRRGAARSR